MASQKPGVPGTHPVPMPIRQTSTSSVMSDDAIPTGDPKDITSLLEERLQAWKHAVGYLEEYVSATEKAQKAPAKEYEKVLKTISNPLKEGHHFDQGLGGIASLLENMRQNTQALSNSHLEAEQNIKSSVTPILERLHKEIKNKSKELSSGAAKGAKEVEKARNNTQKHIELLGQQTASYESTGGKATPSEDPYVVRRGVLHRLSTQILHENNNRHDLIAVQSNFGQFEHHIVEVIEQAMMSFNQLVTGQAQRQQELYADILATTQRVPGDFEWKKFLERSGDILISPNAPDRTLDSIAFPNQNHKSTQALVEGTLERKSRNKLSMSGYSTGYYVVTPSKFLHEFKDNDNLKKDPAPELSIYLPDATIGKLSGEKFNIKGKDLSGSIGGKLSGSSELAFKAHSPSDAQKWYEIITGLSGATPGSLVHADTMSSIASSGSAASPVGQKNPTPLQTQGITGGENVASPTSIQPTSAIDAKTTPPAK